MGEHTVCRSTQFTFKMSQQIPLPDKEQMDAMEGFFEDESGFFEDSTWGWNAYPVFPEHNFDF